MNRSNIFALGALILVSGLGSGQSKRPAKVGIIVSCSCDDPVGRLFATSVRDVIARSPRYFLATEKTQKGANGVQIGLNFDLNVITMDSDDKTNPKGNATIVSSVLLIDGTYVDHFLQNCGSTRTEACAKDLLAGFDEDIEALYQVAAKSQQ
jgi:hypothetical protein